MSELLKFLNEVGVNPVKIINLTVRNKRYEDHSVYLIHFLKKDQIKIAMLRESAKVIDHVRVRWEFYNNKRQGPIQCSNCMQYGHGGNSCFLSPLCIRCGQAHRSAHCPLLIDPTTKEVRTRIPDENLKCGLCGQNHPANFAGCEKRIAFVERQNNYRAKYQRQRPQLQRQPQQQRAFVNAPQLDNAHFPSINPNASAGVNAWAQAPPLRPQLVNQRQPQVDNNQDLFTTTELLSIMRDMMGRLRNCSSKEQQIFALGEICMTYLYGST